MTDDSSSRRAAARSATRRIALVAHDHKKQDLREWADHNRELLSRHALVATGTTGRLLVDELGLQVTCLQSGPLGGDQQIGALIASGDLDLLVFFTDPLHPQPHDSDVKALMRIAVVWNIPIACNRASADLLITSPLLTDYRPGGRSAQPEHNGRRLVLRVARDGPGPTGPARPESSFT